MRPHGRARVSQTFPQAHAICDRCGFRFNHSDLNWQTEWQGPRPANKRILVCKTCLDKPFEPNRTILIPADPVPIPNPRPEYFTTYDNPISPLSADPMVLSGANLGNMSRGGGLGAPYFGQLNKTSAYSALLRPSSSAATANWVGKNWSAVPGLSPALQPPVLSGQLAGLTYKVGSFTATAPIDQSFLGQVAARLTFSGWSGSSWHTLWSGYSAGSKGESLTVGSSQLTDTNPYYVHALSIFGDGVNAAAIAFLQINAIAEGIQAAPAGTPTAPIVSS